MSEIKSPVSLDTEDLSSPREISAGRKAAVIISTIGAAFVGGFIAADYANNEAGPLNGITMVRVDGCGDRADTDGPRTVDGMKMTDVYLTDLADGVDVTVTLRTMEVPEIAVRDAGVIEDPSVPLTGLVVTCEVPLSAAQGELSATLGTD